MDPAALGKSFELNVRVSFQLCQAAARRMIAQRAEIAEAPATQEHVARRWWRYRRRC